MPGFTIIQDSHLQSENLQNQTIEEGEVEKNALEEFATKDIQNSKYVHKRIMKHTRDRQTAFIGNEHDIDYATRERVTRCTAGSISSFEIPTTVPNNHTTINGLQLEDKHNHQSEKHNKLTVNVQSGIITITYEINDLKILLRRDER